MRIFVKNKFLKKKSTTVGTCEKGLLSAAEKFYNIKRRVDYQYNDYKSGRIRRLLKTGLKPAAEKTVYEYRQPGKRQYQPERSPVHVRYFKINIQKIAKNARFFT